MNIKKHIQFWVLGGVSKINRLVTQKQAKPIITVSANKSTHFKIRKNTSDALIITEVWRLQEYAGHPKIRITPKDTILVLGAQIGVFSVFASQKASHGKIISYEPDPENFSLLQQNVSINHAKNVTLVNQAVSKKTGKKVLYRNKINSGGYSFYPSKNSIRPGTIVKTTTLPLIFSTHKLKKVDLMKVDVEGAEYDILLTTPPQILKKIRNIVMEYHDELVPGHKHQEIVDHLENLGFKVDIQTYFLQQYLLKTGFITAIYQN